MRAEHSVVAAMTQCEAANEQRANWAAYLRGEAIEVDVDVAKLGDGQGVHAVTLIEAGKIQLVINTPRGSGPRADGDYIRAAAGRAGVLLLTTRAAALAAAAGLRDWLSHRLFARSLQEYHRGVGGDQLELDLGSLS